MGERDSAGAFKSGTRERLDRLHRGKGSRSRLHVVWFGAWVTINAGAIRGIRPFDPFPFPFLTMTVSLEAPVRNEGGLDTDDA